MGYQRPALWDTSKDCKAARLKRSVGMRPVREFLDTLRDVSAAKRPRSVGSGPLSPALYSMMRVTLPPVLHDTPAQLVQGSCSVPQLVREAELLLEVHAAESADSAAASELVIVIACTARARPRKKNVTSEECKRS